MAAPVRESDGVAPVAPVEPVEPSGLGRELRAFARFSSPRLIAAVLAGVTVARVAVGRWSWADLAVAGAILAFEPFTEWLIHVFVLHAKPRTVLGRRIDSLAARKHRDHHRDPREPALVLVPLGVLVPGLTVAVLAATILPSRVELGLSGLTTGVAMLLTYEWTHHLIHSRYRPRSRYYRSIWRAHRLHHYRNERYWFGVTVNLADHILRTFPGKDAVPVSATARDLGVS